MLAARRLGKKYEGRWIFRGLDFTLEPGQALVVTGRNGSGKSTLLKTLAGLVTPSEGEVERPPDGPVQIGYAALDGALFPQLTVAEHVELVAQWRGVEARTDALLEYIGLAEARDRPAAKLSTGMRNRLKLALAIQCEPPLLILDEPGAAMDEAGKALIASICAAQRERGALIVATNDPAERELGTHELCL